jgi:predicted PurR-regulated permease PerM
MSNQMRISITSGTIIKAIVWVLVATTLMYLSDLVITLLVAVVLASAIEPPVRFLQKYKIPRVVSVAGFFLLIIALLASVAFIFLPPLVDDVVQFVKNLPAILESIRIFGRDMGLKDLASSVSTISNQISKGQILTTVQNIFFGQSGFFATTSKVVGGIFHVVITFVLAFYLALEERGVHKFLRLIAPLRYEHYIEDVWNRSQKKISLWMQGQFLLSFFVALLVYIPNVILDMPYAALLAILAFLGELVPMVGLTLATVPALMIAYAFGGPSLAITIAIIYFVIAQLESHVLYPRIMNRAVGVPSVLIIVSLLVGAKLAGVWGVILAVPLASIIMELSSDYDKRKRDTYHAQ